MESTDIDRIDAEPDFLAADMDTSFIHTLPKSEVIPGISKFVIKRAGEGDIVEGDSRVKLMRHHYTREGDFIKVNNPNFQTGMKLKLGGLGNEELVACVKTMKPSEISYFLIERDVLDKDEIKENPDLLTDAEKKRLSSNKLLDGYYRVEIVEEEKIKKNVAGVSESVESRLDHIASQKEAGNNYFKNYEYAKACKEYMKGFNLSSQFPKKRAEEEKKPELLTRLAELRIDLINNSLKAAYKGKSAASCETLFDKNVVEEMKDNFKYVNSLARIWLDTTQLTTVAMDVSSLIEYLERFARDAKASDEEIIIINEHLKELNRYEKKVNILSNLKGYSEKAEEFERQQKIEEKIRKMQEAANTVEKPDSVQE